MECEKTIQSGHFSFSWRFNTRINRYEIRILLLLLSFSSSSMAEEYTLVIKPLISNGLNTTSTLAIKSGGNQHLDYLKIKGYYTNWSCAFGARKNNQVSVQCHESLGENQSSEWFIITDLTCDSEINLIIGSLMMSCH